VIRDVFHCSFQPAERIAAFDDPARVETAGRLAGDGVLDPVAVADRRSGACSRRRTARTCPSARDPRF